MELLVALIFGSIITAVVKTDNQSCKYCGGSGWAWSNNGGYQECRH